MRSGLYLLAFLSLGAQAALPTFEEVRARDESSEILLLDREGKPMDSYRLDPTYRKAPWVRLDQFAPLTRKILVEIEDQRFYKHHGVDWWALGKSALRFLRDQPTRGASTLTMQLVSLIDPEHARKGRRNVEEKIDQVQAALDLEKTWTKDQILEAYLNLVPLRGEWVGIHSVAHFLFGKTPDALDPVEAALVVAMLPSPNQEWTKIADRACAFLRTVYAAEPEKASELCTAARGRRLDARDAGPARWTEHYTRYYVDSLPPRERRGGVHRTTLDLALQERVARLARETLLSISQKNVGEISALVLDHRSGEILAYVGNLPALSNSEHVDGIQGRRQAGSTLKPFFYAYALQKHKFDLHSELLDEAIQVETTNGAFRPENYDHVFHGWVPLPTALASSLNIPAIKVVQEVGIDESTELVKRLGVREVKPGYVYGPSLALGTVDLTLEELTRAYAKLARQALGRADPKFPIEVEPARQVTRILSHNPSRSMTFGMNSVIATPYFTAVKTGTSKDMRDNWCVGYSDRYAVGVWVGNFKGGPMQDVSGVSGAAPLWRKVMDALHSNSPSVMPPDIAKIEIPEPKSTMQARAEELRPAAGSPKIVYPHEGSVLAVDPEIPRERQKVLLKTTQMEKGYRWVLNGHELGSLTEPTLWLIDRGKQVLEIQDDSRRVLDQVRFLVK